MEAAHSAPTPQEAVRDNLRVDMSRRSLEAIRYYVERDGTFYDWTDHEHREYERLRMEV